MIFARRRRLGVAGLVTALLLTSPPARGKDSPVTDSAYAMTLANAEMERWMRLQSRDPNERLEHFLSERSASETEVEQSSTESNRCTNKYVFFESGLLPIKHYQDVPMYYYPDMVMMEQLLGHVYYLVMYGNHDTGGFVPRFCVYIDRDNGHILFNKSM